MNDNYRHYGLEQLLYQCGNLLLQYWDPGIGFNVGCFFFTCRERIGSMNACLLGTRIEDTCIGGYRNQDICLYLCNIPM